jgi:hypothetical protein
MSIGVHVSLRSLRPRQHWLGRDDGTCIPSLQARAAQALAAQEGESSLPYYVSSSMRFQLRWTQARLKLCVLHLECARDTLCCKARRVEDAAARQPDVVSCSPSCASPAHGAT